MRKLIVAAALLALGCGPCRWDGAGEDAPPPAEKCSDGPPLSDLRCAPGTCWYPSDMVCR